MRPMTFSRRLPEIPGRDEPFAATLPSLAAHVDGEQPRLANDRHHLRRAPMHELGAELDRCGGARIAMREDSSANAIARLEHFHAHAALAQRTRGGESGHTGAHDDDVRLRESCSTDLRMPPSRQNAGHACDVRSQYTRRERCVQRREPAAEGGGLAFSARTHLSYFTDSTHAHDRRHRWQCERELDQSATRECARATRRGSIHVRASADRRSADVQRRSARRSRRHRWCE